MQVGVGVLFSNGIGIFAFLFVPLFLSLCPEYYVLLILCFPLSLRVR